MASAGFKLISEGVGKSETDAPLRFSFLRPYPRLVEGRAIRAAGGHTAIDVSDGLIADLKHICISSMTGACVRTDQIPVHPTACEAFPDQALDMALSGGEDYELLFSADAAVIDKVKRKTSTTVTVIGEMTAGPAGVVKVIDADGNPYQLKKTGWDHFGRT